MMANDIRGWMGPKFSDICLAFEKKFNKENDPTGYRTQVERNDDTLSTIAVPE